VTYTFVAHAISGLCKQLIINEIKLTLLLSGSKLSKKPTKINII
jgi:hypothetical protein